MEIRRGILKHKDIEVAEIEVAEGGRVRILKTIHPEHYPLSIVRENGKIDERRFLSWWEERGIPDTRDGIQDALRELGVSNTKELLIGYHGLSLTDHYWVDDEKGGRRWKDINFYENDFDMDIGNLFFNRKKKAGKYSVKSPDDVSNGNLKKRWIIGDDGKRYLLKGGTEPFLQEPCNEVIASEMCRRLGIPHVPYKLIMIDGEPVSKCINMTSKDVEFIDAISVFNLKEQTAFADDFYNQYCECAKSLQVRNIEAMLDRMMVLDYLLLNHDRHFRNFGILRDSSDLGKTSAAPIFDSGTSLYCKEGSRWIISPEKKRATHRNCFTSLAKQLGLVKSWNWYDGKKLEGIELFCDEVFSRVPEVETERGKKIGEMVRKRIMEVDWYIENRVYTDKKNGHEHPKGRGR
jgi:hypothetical protein